MPEPYTSLQRQWINGSDLKVGDRVICVDKANAVYDGWSGRWWQTMDRLIGKEGEVLEIDADLGIRVDFAEGLPFDRQGSWLPFYLLINVEHD